MYANANNLFTWVFFIVTVYHQLILNVLTLLCLFKMWHAYSYVSIILLMLLPLYEIF